jgi:hypothetical protein
MSNSTAELYIARAHVVTSETPLFPESRSVAVRACVYDLRLRKQISLALSRRGIAWGGEELRQHDAADALVQTAQQAFTHEVDRGGEDGAALQLSASHAL